MSRQKHPDRSPTMTTGTLPRTVSADELIRWFEVGCAPLSAADQEELTGDETLIDLTKPTQRQAPSPAR